MHFIALFMFPKEPLDNVENGVESKPDPEP
jgi:hypothetical protein